MSQEILEGRVRSVLALIADNQDPRINTGHDGTQGLIHIDTDAGPHIIRAKAWWEDTVQLSFTVDTETALKIAKAYDAIAANIPVGSEVLDLLDDVSAAAQSMYSHFKDQMPKSDVASRGELITRARNICDIALRSAGDNADEED